MMKKHIVVFLTFILGLSVSLTAQPVLDIHIINTNIETVYLSDMDILQLAAADDFFELAIHFDNQAYNDCRLTLSFYKDDQLLARIHSKSFPIPARTGMVSATNVELMQDKFYLTDTPDPEYLIEVSESNLDTDQIDNIERDLLSSGKLPVGHYVLEGILEGIGEPSMDRDEFDITNPNFIQQIAPGTEAGSGFKEEIYTEFPVFQWNGNGSEYEVVVFEKKFALQSLDNILNMNPNWQSDRLESFAVQYPQAGEVDKPVIPLEFDKTYFWIVKMFIQTSAGEESVNSEIWEFKLIDPINLGDEQGAIARNELIDFLRDLIGEKADELAKQLGDYDVRTINVNGKDITLEDLYQLINEYRLKDVEVVDLILPAGSY